MKTRSSLITAFLSGVIFAFIILLQFSFSEKGSAGSKNVKTSLPEWNTPPLPAKMDFANEPVPLQRWEIKEQLDRELLLNYYSTGSTLYALKLATRYFPLIEERLKANGIPNDFKYLCVAESHLQNATSKAGAVGFWQFMKTTSPGYDLEINNTVDQRYDLMLATDAACVYLKKAYEKFGSWTAAAASYNCGMGGYQSQAGFQGTNNYYDLLLPDETQRYIFRILALKYILTHEEELGYRISDEEKYEPVATRAVTVSQSIPDLVSFAKENGTNYKMLKWLNPWLRARSLTVSPGKTYTILVAQRQ